MSKPVSHYSCPKQNIEYCIPFGDREMTLHFTDQKTRDTFLKVKTSIPPSGLIRFLSKNLQSISPLAEKDVKVKFVNEEGQKVIVENLKEKVRLAIYFFPNELLLRIFEKLAIKELKNTSLVCKQWTTVSQDQSLLFPLYRQIVKKIFPYKSTETLKNHGHSFSLNSYALIFPKHPSESIKIMSQTLIETVYKTHLKNFKSDFKWTSYAWTPAFRSRSSFRWDFPNWNTYSEKNWCSSENPDAYFHEYVTISGVKERDGSLDGVSISRGKIVGQLCHLDLAPNYQHLLNSIIADIPELTEQRSLYGKRKHSELTK